MSRLAIGLRRGERPPAALHAHRRRQAAARARARGHRRRACAGRRVAAALAPDYDAIMVDARGHGRSDAPERGYGPAEQAADLAGVIAALGLRAPAGPRPLDGRRDGARARRHVPGSCPAPSCWRTRPAWWTDWSDTPDARRAPGRDARAGSWVSSRRRARSCSPTNAPSSPAGQTPSWNPGRTPSSDSARTS